MFQQKSSAFSLCLDRAHFAAEQRRRSRTREDRKFWSDLEAKWHVHAERYEIRRIAMTFTRSAEPNPVETYDRAALNRRLGKVRSRGA